MKERHMYAGNNTSKGFYSYFSYLTDPANADRIYILKGGPGVGKSSFMKKFGAKMLSKGYSVEYIHCSSDNDSLDGIMVPEIKTVLVDGTAPHTVDPKVPGAVDEIINLGEFLDTKKMEKHKFQIMQINKRKSELYKSAYRFLECAGLISDEINSIYSNLTDNDKFNEICRGVIDKVFPDEQPYSKPGNERKLFSEAYTANGYINQTETLCDGSRIWAVSGENTNYTSDLLEKIKSEALTRGYDAECYYRPLKADKLQHLFIPELNIMFKSVENHMSCSYEEVINMQGIMDLEELKLHISEIENNLHMYDMLIKNGLEKLTETKKLHELLEVFYVNCMNFEGVDKCFNNLISKYR